MACDQQSISAALLQSYKDAGGINHLDGANLPSKCAVAGLCHDLLTLMFPGFFESSVVREEDIPDVTEARVSSLLARLKVEARRSLMFQKEVPENIGCVAWGIACRFMSSLPGVRELLRTDVEAAFDGDPAANGFEEVILAYPFIEAVAIQRMAHVLYREGLPLVPRMMTEWAHNRTGIDIHPGAEIGSHFFIDHGTGVVIGETAHIGSHVKLYQGVGLVARSLAAGQRLKGQRRHPTLGDHVTVYANATIVGDIVVGSGSTIGANVFVTEPVAPDSVVALGEQKNEVRLRQRPRVAAS